MLVEGAFFKLPELLLGYPAPNEQYEATLTSALAMATLQELNSRNVNSPLQRVHIERPYPQVTGLGSPGRADLYIDLGKVYGTLQNSVLYGLKAQNWLEAKFFGGIGRQSSASNQNTTDNAGTIVVDLCRLCLYLKDASKQRQIGRYWAGIFNRHPKSYLPFQNSVTNSPRKWLTELLTPGEHTIAFSLSSEPKTLKKSFGEAFINESLDLTARVITTCFAPIVDQLPNSSIYWGYLVRVVDFELSLGNMRLKHVELDHGTSDYADQDQMIKRFYQMSDR